MCQTRPHLQQTQWSWTKTIRYILPWPGVIVPDSHLHLFDVTYNYPSPATFLLHSTTEPIPGNLVTTASARSPVSPCRNSWAFIIYVLRLHRAYQPACITYPSTE